MLSSGIAGSSLGTLSAIGLRSSYVMKHAEGGPAFSYPSEFEAAGGSVSWPYVSQNGGTQKGFNAMWLEFDFPDEGPAIAAVRQVEAILDRRHLPMRRVEPEIHCRAKR